MDCSGCSAATSPADSFGVSTLIAVESGILIASLFIDVAPVMEGWADPSHCRRSLSADLCGWFSRNNCCCEGEGEIAYINWGFVEAIWMNIAFAMPAITVGMESINFCLPASSAALAFLSSSRSFSNIYTISTFVGPSSTASSLGLFFATRDCKQGIN